MMVHDTAMALSTTSAVFSAPISRESAAKFLFQEFEADRHRGLFLVTIGWNLICVIRASSRESDGNINLAVSLSSFPI